MNGRSVGVTRRSWPRRSAWPRNLAQLEDYLAARDVRLDDDQYRRLDEASQIPLGQPHDLVNSRRGPLLGGSTFESPVVPVA